jgi:hypothetical protein
MKMEVGGVGTTGDVTGETRKGAMGISTNPWSKKTQRSRRPGKDNASSGEKMAPYGNYPMFRRGIPWYKWSRIAPKRPRLELEAKPFDKHGSSIDAAQSGSRQVCGCRMG